MAKCRMELRAYKTAVSIRNPLLRASSLNRFHMFSDFPIISMAVSGSWLGSKDGGGSKMTVGKIIFGVILDRVYSKSL